MSVIGWSGYASPGGAQPVSAMKRASVARISVPLARGLVIPGHAVLSGLLLFAGDSSTIAESPPGEDQMRRVSFLQGAFTPLVVPFKDGEVDYDRYAKLIEWQIEQGTHGLLVNATSGEPTTLTFEEKAQLIEVAVKTSAKRKPVAAGIPA